MMCRGLRVGVMGTLLAVALQASFCADLRGDVSIEETLREKSFPWYDAQRDDYRPMQPLPEPEMDTTGINVEGGLPIGKWLMWVVLGTLVGLLLYHVLRWGLDWAGGERAPEIDSNATLDVDRLDALPEATRKIRDLLGHARSLVEQRRYGEAMTFYHSWQLVQLDQQGTIELQKGKTNHQYLDEVESSRPDLEKLFAFSTRLFEDKFFGGLEIGEKAFLSVWEKQTSFGVTGTHGGSR